MALNIPMDSGAKTPEEIAAHEAKMVEAAKGASISRTGNDLKQTIIQTGEQGVKPAPGDAPAAPTVRPEGVPEKFWDATKGAVNTEALLKSYSELEKAQSKPKAEAVAPVEAPKADGAKASFADLQAAASAEFANTGALSADTYTALQAAGFSKPMVDQYIAGAKASGDAEVNAVLTGAGTTPELFAAANEWAKESFSAEDKKAFNDALGNSAAATFAVRSLMERYSREGDVAPTTTVHGGSNPNSGGYFKSRAEMVTAMSDPQYKKDPAFRAAVAQKMAGSARAKIDLFA